MLSVSYTLQEARLGHQHVSKLAGYDLSPEVLYIWKKAETERCTNNFAVTDKM